MMMEVPHAFLVLGWNPSWSLWCDWGDSQAKCRGTGFSVHVGPKAIDPGVYNFSTITKPQRWLCGLRWLSKELQPWSSSLMIWRLNEQNPHLFCGCSSHINGTGSSNLAYPNFVSLTSGTHHVWAHLSVTQSQEKSGLQSQRIRLPHQLRMLWTVSNFVSPLIENQVNPQDNLMNKVDAVETQMLRMGTRLTFIECDITILVGATSSPDGTTKTLTSRALLRSIISTMVSLIPLVPSLIPAHLLMFSFTTVEVAQNHTIIMSLHA
jgi:hypothetical protein